MKHGDVYRILASRVGIYHLDQFMQINSNGHKASAGFHSKIRGPRKVQKCSVGPLATFPRLGS